MDINNFRHALAASGKTNKLSKNPFLNVPRGVNVINTAGFIGEVGVSPILLREEY